MSFNEIQGKRRTHLVEMDVRTSDRVQFSDSSAQRMNEYVQILNRVTRPLYVTLRAPWNGELWK